MSLRGCRSGLDVLGGAIRTGVTESRAGDKHPSDLLGRQIELRSAEVYSASTLGGESTWTNDAPRSYLLQ